MTSKTEPAAFILFDWSRAERPRFEGKGDLRSVELDGRRVTFNTRIGEDLNNLRNGRPLKWAYDGLPAEIRTVALNPLRARFDIPLGDPSFSLASRSLGFDIHVGGTLEARQRRGRLKHRSDASSELLAACIAVNAFHLDRRLTMQSVMIDNLGLLGQRPGVFAGRS